MVFASLYIVVLSAWTPKELIDVFLAPITDLASVYGKMLFEASFGYEIPYVDTTEIISKIGGSTNPLSSIIPGIYNFLNSFNQVIMTPFALGKELINYGFSTLSIPTLLIGMGIFGIFAFIWYKIFMILTEVVLGLIMILMLFPFVAFGLVFPISRSTSINVLKQIWEIGITLAILPIILVFNSRMMMAFLSKSDPQTGQTASLLLESGDIESLVRFFDLKSSMVFEAFFIGLLIIYITNNMQEYIKKFAKVNLGDSGLKESIDDYHKKWTDFKDSRRKKKEEELKKSKEHEKSREKRKEDYKGKTKDEKRDKFADTAKSRGKK